MKQFLAIIFSFFSVAAFSQENKATQQFSVEGMVNKPYTFTFSDSSKYTSVSVDSLVVYNHLMERRKTLKAIKGVLLKEIINAADIKIDKAKLLSEFYIVCVANDGYKVTFSWNELFNTPVGNTVLVITSMEGKSAAGLSDGITILSAADKATGRRLVYGLSKVIIKRAE